MTKGLYLRRMARPSFVRGIPYASRIDQSDETDAGSMAGREHSLLACPADGQPRCGRVAHELFVLMGES